MKFIKKYFKMFIGICVLVMVVLVFFFAKRGESLEIGTLKDWRAASIDRRVASVQILTARGILVSLLSHLRSSLMCFCLLECFGQILGGW